MLQEIPTQVSELCSSVVEPTYVYDLSKLRRSASDLKDAFKGMGALVLFATMANPRSEILETLSGLGVGACVNSVAHLRAALRAGMKRDRIQFTSSGLSMDDFEEIASLKIQCNVDSARQAAMLLAVSDGGTCGVRVNTRLLLDEALSAHDRLGLDPIDIPALNSLIETRSGRLNGTHIYVGTNFHQHEEMLPALDGFFGVAATVPGLDYVNVGGGIGVDYTRLSQEFDVGGYAQAIGQRLDTLRAKLGRHVQLIIEPGRAMVASSGYFTCRVTDIKKLRGLTFVGVNASVAQFPRPWHHPETPHAVFVARSTGGLLTGVDEDSMDVVIAGRTTYSKDVLATARLPSDLAVGDSLIFVDAGAYCDSMASRFLGQPETASVFLN